MRKPARELPVELTPRSFCLLLLAAFGMERGLRLTPTDSAAARLTGRFVYLGGTLLWGCGRELLFRRFVDRPKHSDAGELSRAGTMMASGLLCE